MVKTVKYFWLQNVLTVQDFKSRENLLIEKAVKLCHGKDSQIFLAI